MIGTPQVGVVLQGRYRIVGVLGLGGMGRVLKAEDLRLPGRLCAIKEMIPPTSYTPQSLAQARQQFQVEAQILAKLDHPNLPKVSDYFTEGGRDYLVMDFVEGQNLQEIKEQTPDFLPEGEVIRWAGQICDVLEYLHSRKPNPVIHRDIKPANIKVTPDGMLKLVDFGIAKLYDVGQQTATGIRGSGTPGYAPFEQYGRGRTDARTDIYALGATLYHLLTGQLPTEIVERLSGKPLPSIRGVNSQVSKQVEDAILKAMSPKPDDRFQSAAEFKRALMGSAKALPAAPSVFSLQRLKRVRWLLQRVAGGVGLAILVILFLWLASHIVSWLRTASATVGSWLRSLSGSPIVTFAKDNWLGITIVVALAVVILNRRRLLGLVQPIRDWLVRALARLRARRPKLEVVEPQSRQLHFKLKADLEKPEQLRIQNVGGGVLRCRIESSVPWLKVEPASFRCNKQVVEVWVIKSAIPRGQGHLKLISNGGRALVLVSFEVEDTVKPSPPPLPSDLLIGREQELQNLTERLVQHQGGHYLLYGYGQFGATTFIKHLLRRVAARLENLEGRGVLMTIHLDLRWHEPSEVIQGMVNEFCCEVIKGDFNARKMKRLMRQLNRRKDLTAHRTKKGFKIEAAFPPSIGAEFSRETDSTGSLPAQQQKLSENEILELTEEWLDSNPGLLERMINRLLRRGSPPSRVIFVLDKVDAPEQFEALRRSRIFSHQGVDFIAVVRKEHIDLWEEDRRGLDWVEDVLKSDYYYSQYFRCLWEDVYVSEGRGFVSTVLRVAYPAILDCPDGASVVDHLAFVSRGATGSAVTNIVRHVSYEGSHDRGRIQFNAERQRMLSRNWNKILGRKRFLDVEDEDRARLGVYYLLAWLEERLLEHIKSERDKVTESDIRQAARQSPVTISPTDRHRRATVGAFLKVLLKEELLVQWGDAFLIGGVEMPLMEEATRGKSSRKRRVEWEKRTWLAYDDLDLLLTGDLENSEVRVIYSPRGDSCVGVPMAVELEAAAFLLELVRKRKEELSASRVLEFGTLLFHWLFPVPIEGLYRASLAASEEEEKGLRLRLRIESPELQALPWELAYDQETDSFLALAAQTPMIRYPVEPQPVSALQTQPPLRILVVAASPSDLPPLDVRREQGRLHAKLAPLKKRKLVDLSVRLKLPRAKLPDWLDQGYHVFHFIGYGSAGDDDAESRLILMGIDGRSEPVTAGELGILLRDSGLRLAVLNACGTGEVTRGSPSVSTAIALVRAGIPAVVAMQADISDESAIAFSEGFYCRLARGAPLEGCMYMGRKNVLAATGLQAPMDWAAPVLLMRTGDGRLFEIRA